MVVTSSLDVRRSRKLADKLWYFFRHWGIYLILLAGVLYFFAPRNWFQFGVWTQAERVQTSNFSLRKMDGVGSWNLRGVRGDVLVVNYWATWCGPCRFETPSLVNLSKEFKDKDFQIVGVTMDEDLSLVPEFVKEFGIEYPILLPGADPNLAKGNIRLPTTFLYDKQGRVAKKYEGIALESTLRADINALLKE